MEKHVRKGDAIKTNDNVSKTLVNCLEKNA